MKKIVFTKKFMTQSDRQLLRGLGIIVIFVLAIVLVIAIILEIVGWGGNVNFYKKWIECGHKPLEIHGTGFMNVGVEHYVESPTIDLLRYNPEYYCTPLEAEKAGHSADSDHDYFPHLEAERNSQ